MSFARGRTELTEVELEQHIERTERKLADLRNADLLEEEQAELADLLHSIGCACAWRTREAA